MNYWKVTWMDGIRLREIIVYSDVYNIASNASGQGVQAWGIIKIEQVAQA